MTPRGFSWLVAATTPIIVPPPRRGIGRFDSRVGVFGYRFARDGNLIDVVWAPFGGEAVLTSGGDAQVYDLDGTDRTVERQGGELRIPVGADPVYVVYTAVTVPGAP